MPASSRWATFTIPKDPVRRRIHGIQTFNVLRGGEYLLDKEGRIRWMHVGEGDYYEAERLIQMLLAEEETKPEDKSAI